MFKKWSLILSYVLLNIATVFSQDFKISQPLKNLIKDDNMVNVNIYLKNIANIDSLYYEIKKSNIPVKNRPEIVKRYLMNHASNTQKRVLQIINENSKFTDVEYHQFWLVNLISAKVDKNLLYELAKCDDVELIDVDNTQIISPVEPIVDKPKSLQSVNGREPGLTAINAPAMWALGYTGKGRIACLIDTGVWPNHPALKNNFIGNNFPLKQAWYGYHSELPVDKTGTHGTHVTGTMLGLEREANDTIGVAFDAYYIATDPVATSLSEAKPLTDFLFAFQWVFDPDGDSTTTEDIPDVLNNSWGYDVPSDTILCSSFVVQIFSALETAGIACVFSAGNSGPLEQTISSPHHVTINEVNSFTVGSINGNNSNYLISSFSSRGPTICNVDSSLKIKPEVVAPGEYVRSAIGQSGYDYKSGTSMASPHVSGAVLLLKEAFPFLSGFEILRALYNSATDLGIMGEDNSYGNGIINVYAAYNYLCQLYSPVPPVSQKFDAAISEIIIPDKNYYCTNSFSPKVIIKNLGDSSLNNAIINYRLNDEPWQTFYWSGNLSKNQSDTLQLNPITALGTSDYELQVKIQNLQNIVEYNRFNNSLIKRFNIRSVLSLPYFQDFENNSLKQSGLLVINPDKSITWGISKTSGIQGSDYSLSIKLNDYLPIANQKDELLLPILNIPDSNSITLKYDWAYRFAGLADTLKILASEDCGLSFPYLLHKKAGQDMNTTNALTSFVPSQPSDWKEEIVNISQVKNKSVLIKFETTNRHGSNLYIDNLHIYAGSDVSVPFYSDKIQLHIFPNPFNSSINCSFSKILKGRVDFQIFDITGKLIESFFFENIDHSIAIDLSNLNQGFYLMQTNYLGTKIYTKIIKSN